MINQSWNIYLGLIIRLGFIMYAEIQDKFFNLKYTDIDYSVYTDGARYVVEGGTPYDRHTYRYTPILAYMMIPNLYYEAFGKILFSFIDMGSCLIMKQFVDNSQSKFFLNLWIFNPLTIQVSTRGNADTIVVFLIYLMLYLLKKSQITYAAIVYGFVVHFKIYPIIYALPLYFYIDSSSNKIFGYIFSKDRIKFSLISGGLFIALLIIFHFIYPDRFLYETYIYHLIRKDNRHNFSPYFYFIYLSYSSITKVQSILTFIPQLLIVVTAGIKYYKDLPFAFLIQTFGFVVFNKVQTAQYFVWWMALLPITLCNSKLSKKQIIILLFIWLICEIQWNVGAYLLEIRGYDAFTLIFIQCIIFFLSNIYFMDQIIKNHQLSVFENLKLKGQ
ncbi:hypothetical protein pb186bvf_017602 [Paramecium bursaria]